MKASILCFQLIGAFFAAEYEHKAVYSDVIFEWTTTADSLHFQIAAPTMGYAECMRQCLLLIQQLINVVIIIIIITIINTTIIDIIIIV